MEYSLKLEYLKREEELIKEEELEAEALLQPSGQTLQVQQQAHSMGCCLIHSVACNACGRLFYSCYTVASS